MSSIEGLIPNTMEALAGSLESNISHDLRTQYQEYLSNLQNNPDCPLVFCQILTQQFEISASTMNFANEGLCLITLTLLNDFLKKKWTVLSAPQQNHLRTLLSNLLSYFNDASFGYSVNLCNKFASILTELAERQYPQLWPTFLQDFLGLLQENSYKKQQVLLRVFEFLYMDCLDTDFSSNLPIVRRTEIISALQNNQKDLIEIFYRFFFTNLSQLSAILAEESQDPTGANLALKESKKKVYLHLQVFLSLLFYFIKIINVEYFLTHEQNYFPLILSCLEHEELQTDALHVMERLLGQEFTQYQSLNPSSVLSSASSRPGAAGDFGSASQSSVFLLDVILAHMFENPKQKTIPKDTEKLYNYVTVYLNSLVSFVHLNTSELFAQNLTIYTKSPQVLTTRHNFLNVLMQDMLELFQFPSRLMLKDAINYLIKLSKNANFYNFLYKNEFLNLILNSFFVKFFSFSSVEKEDEEWYEVDFNSDEEEFKQYYAFVLSQFRLFINEVHLRLPKLTMKYLVEKINYFLNELESLSLQGGTGKKAKRRWVECNKHLALFMSLLESLGNASYGLVEAGPSQPASSTSASSSAGPVMTPELLQDHREGLTSSLVLIDQLLQWNPAKYKVKKTKLLTLSFCSCLFFLVPDKLVETITSLFQWIRELHAEAIQAHLGPTVQTDDLSANDLCEYSGQILSILIQKCGDKLFKLNNSYILFLLNEVNSILSVSAKSDPSTFYASMSLAMREALVILSFYTEDKATKEQIFVVALEPMLREFQDLVNKNFSSVEGFIHLVHEDLQKSLSIVTTPPSPLLSSTSQSISLLHKLVHGILAISNITSKIQTHLHAEHFVWQKIHQLQTLSLSGGNLAYPFNPTEAGELYQAVLKDDPAFTYLGEFCNCLLIATNTLTQLWDLPVFQYLTVTSVTIPSEYFPSLPQSLQAKVGGAPSVQIPLSSFIYGLSKTEFFKYSDNSDDLLRLLQQKHSQSLFRGVQEELCNALSLLYKSLGQLSSQKIFFLNILLNSFHYHLFLTIHSTQKYFENNFLIYTLKNFYENFFTHFFLLFFTKKTNKNLNYFLNEIFLIFFNNFFKRFEFLFNKENYNKVLFNLLSSTHSDIFLITQDNSASNPLSKNPKNVERQEIEVVEPPPFTPYDETCHITSLYLHSSLYASHLVYSDLLHASSSDLLFTIRHNLQKGLLSMMGQFLAAIFGLRGLLSVKANMSTFSGGGTGAGTLVGAAGDKKYFREDYELVRANVLYYFLNTNEKIFHVFFSFSFLIVSKSEEIGIIKNVFAILDLINNYLTNSGTNASQPKDGGNQSVLTSSVLFFHTPQELMALPGSSGPSGPSGASGVLTVCEPPLLTQFLTKDLFNAVLEIIIKSDPWIEGNEWDFIDYINNTIAKYSLAEQPVQVVKKNKAVAFDNMSSWSNSETTSPSAGLTVKFSIPHIKLELLLKSNLFNPYDVINLKGKLLEAKARRKRDVLKDFFTPVIKKKTKADKVQDLTQAKYNKPKQREKYKQTYDTEVGGLFAPANDWDDL